MKPTNNSRHLLRSARDVIEIKLFPGSVLVHRTLQDEYGALSANLQKSICFSSKQEEFSDEKFQNKLLGPWGEVNLLVKEPVVVRKMEVF